MPTSFPERLKLLLSKTPPHESGRRFLLRVKRSWIATGEGTGWIAASRC